MMHFDRARAMAWLATDAVRRDGAVWSWRGEGAYPYPEAAAIVLRLMRQGLAGDETAVTRRIEAGLWRDLAADRIGKGGHVYTFDLGIVLAALAGRPDPRLATLRDRIAHAVRERRAVWPPAPERWSTLVGPHFLKLAIGLHASGVPADALPPVLLDPSLRQQDAAGRIGTPPHAATYVHAHCYAAEGLMALACIVPFLRRALTDVATRAAVWLARIQRDDGAIPAWHDGHTAVGPYPTDVCAQAIRLWCLVDRVGFDPCIARARRHLDANTLADGAVSYHPGRRHANVWCTAFAVQATAWADGAPADALATL
jgi:hypothetical protein